MKIFKGTINGKEFSTVDDYNAEMKRLIESGAEISATSSTQVVPDPAPEGEISKEDLVLYPGFEDPEEYYLDALVNGDDEDPDRAARAVEYANECSTEVVNNIDKFDVDEIRDILSNIEDIKKVLDDDEADTDEALAKLENSKKLLINSKVVIDNYRTFYNNMYTYMQKQFEKLGGKRSEPLQKPAVRSNISDVFNRLIDVLLN